MEERTSSRRSRAKGPITDIVYMMLKQKGNPMHQKEIMEALADILGSQAESKARLYAEVHTEINLDNRFTHVGGGTWGLREWAPRRVALQRPAPAWQPKQTKPRRPTEIWRGDDDLQEESAKEDEDPDWPKDIDDEDRPEA